MDANSPSGQISSFNTAMAKYHSDLYDYIIDTTGGVVPPELTPIVSAFDYSELLRVTLANATGSCSYENGAAIENINSMVAITRESNLARKNKINYYADASDGAMDESNMYSTLNIFWTNMINGIYSSGEIV